MNDKKPKWWTPFFLGRKISFAFLIAYIALISTLAALYQFSNTHKGIATADPKQYLLWQYGPTAIFTIVAAFWGQVEYRVKQLMPWKTMSNPRGSKPADQTLLLDFVSPLNVISFVRALRSRKTTAVAIVIGGGFVLKLTTILTTGLFILRSTIMEHTVADMMASIFFVGIDPSDFHSVIVDRRAFSRLYGIQKFSLPYPRGTTSCYAYPNFNASKVPDSTLHLSGHVDVFHSNLDCESLSLQHAEGTHVATGTNLSLSFFSESCGQVDLRATYSPQGFFLKWNVFEPEDMGCADDDTRLVTTFGKTTADNTSGIIPLHLVNHSTILCRWSYGISPGLVTVRPNSTAVETVNIEVTPGTSPSHLPGIPPGNLLKAIHNSWTSWRGDTSIDDLTYSTILVMTGVTGEAMAKDATTFANAVNTVFQAFAAQLANIHFTKPTKQPINGTITYKESRLVIRPLPFGSPEELPLTGSGFRGYSGHPRSPDVTSALHGTGSSHLMAIREKLLGYDFTTLTSHTASGVEFSIEKSALVVDEEKEQGKTVQANEECNMGKIKWYRPVTVALPTQFAVVLVPLGLIVLLETLYQQSQKNNGIYNVSSSEYIHYAYTYDPTTILVIAGLLFSGLDSSVKMFQPYQLLRRGGALAKDTLGGDYMGKLGMYCIWSSIWRRHLAVAASSVRMLFVPLLTIAASGMFFVDSLPRSYGIPLSTLEPVNTSFLAQNSVGWDMANLVLGEGLGQPLFTYDTLVFPLLEVPSGTQEGSITARIPAFRAQSNCSASIASNVSVSNTGRIAFNVGLPELCSLDNPGIQLFSNSTDSFYFGEWIDLAAASDPLCPSNVAVFGHTAHGAVTNLSILVCTPYLETVDVDIVLDSADLLFNLTRAPPKPVESTAVYVQNLTSLRDIAKKLYNGWFTTRRDSGPWRINDTIADGFFFTLLNDAAPADLVANDTNYTPLRVAVDRTYGRAMAQVMNTQRAQGPSGAIEATLTVPDRVRLKQGPISTRILEAFLAVLSLCAMLAYAALDTKQVLPNNPCSIAAVASLLAGSSILDTCFPPGSEWQRDGLGKNMTFRLGWWPHGRFGLDIETVEEKKEES
ncbi:uncharacterized protein K452DRAFT_358124 [Aplosporella prunicola CBS 121167]|uniref:Uncharacterized protein n=1 Tax=Aplosporella prunicola CBS 121167 TaxID=1176127 RepID=A0A6A6BG68_9PEZI|nr:uncharacterized protein K452DRAFT_358124 [Aplosporella prunicola CBS 121167]KAF2142285.1 hypothetical protein K452DRAFT_358124 [Aplosporella prunicola CBS 121167]